MTVRQLMNDEQFVSALYAAEDFSQMQVLFREKGIELTEKEIMEYACMRPGREGELGEQALEFVNGGGSVKNWALHLLREFAN